MGIHVGTGLSISPDPYEGAMEAGTLARAGLAGETCDLALVFASGAHLAAPETTLEAVHEALRPDALIGCGAGGVIGSLLEVEDGTAVSVWAAHLGEGSATAFHAAVEEIEEGAGALTGMEDLTGAAGAILLADPATFPTDAVLRFLSDSTPMLPLLGGLASGRLEAAGRRCSTATTCSRRARSASGSTASRCSRASPRARRRSAPSSRSRRATGTSSTSWRASRRWRSCARRSRRCRPAISSSSRAGC